jgi:enamine deaminase RidA (YjgF/YER057c/UK114 family)
MRPIAISSLGTKGFLVMSITRHQITDGCNRLPIISRALVHGDVVYLCGVTPDPVGDIKVQTKQVLERVDRLLKAAGTDKSRLLTAQVWLSDMRLFEDHNEAWNEWVDPKNPPVRACVRADLWRPNMLVEIMVTAAK